MGELPMKLKSFCYSAAQPNQKSLTDRQRDGEIEKGQAISRFQTGVYDSVLGDDFDDGRAAARKNRGRVDLAELQNNSDIAS